ncbi:MAG: tRNA (adenosine(37)-N6)-threonylcarbamoyltransferase complex transferase subunit TsaD [Mycoplasmoidaceae bacterium]
MNYYIIGIETSCDDTSISVLKNDQVISCVTISSEKELIEFGGIIPEIASREHVKNIMMAFKKMLDESNIDINEINLISYTSNPGLPTCLHIGKIFAKTLSWYLDVELMQIDHIHAHIFSPFINNEKEIKYPFISLIVSGGTTSLYKVTSPKEIQILNYTKDDALGEAYDKIGRYLNLPYPGGPSIDEIFDENHVTEKYKIPPASEPFSFSGIKSKIKRIIDDSNQINQIELASNFQYWAISYLLSKIEYYSNEYNSKIVCIGGGVSANKYFRNKIKNSNIKYLFPEKKYSCDNAAMIAFLSFLQKKY